ncbi:CPCC family cysteine-rich protein [Lacinutrix venerupis]|uniref:Cysteine-rich CPCC domain-containing protein n=1 Tax=Lacinutrix venerupis TaxID=1486034 RepID=A0AAC9LJV1_9FLAO|nr:CPCC family cysteine-rich protein [Lacinutrix venerupis]APX99748.1 hypothetical protein BWR22_05300 [Lacinutrix venerupis]
MSNNKNDNWFSKYTTHREESESRKYEMFNEHFICPCCGYPTLSERAAFEICSLCFWEDDGQDEHNANEILGGPNSNYSLVKAKQNFLKYYTMYEPNDKDKFEMTTVKKNYLGKVVLDKVSIKKRIIKKYKQLIELKNEKEQNQLWKEIKILEKKL